MSVSRRRRLSGETSNNIAATGSLPTKSVSSHDMATLIPRPPPLTTTTSPPNLPLLLSSDSTVSTLVAGTTTTTSTTRPPPARKLPRQTEEQLLSLFVKYDGITREKIPSVVAELNLSVPVDFEVASYFFVPGTDIPQLILQPDDLFRFVYDLQDAIGRPNNAVLDACQALTAASAANAMPLSMADSTSFQIRSRRPSSSAAHGGGSATDGGGGTEFVDRSTVESTLGSFFPGGDVADITAKTVFLPHSSSQQPTPTGATSSDILQAQSSLSRAPSTVSRLVAARNSNAEPPQQQRQSVEQLQKFLASDDRISIIETLFRRCGANHDAGYGLVLNRQALERIYDDRQRNRGLSVSYLQLSKVLDPSGCGDVDLAMFQTVVEAQLAEANQRSTTEGGVHHHHSSHNHHHHNHHQATLVTNAAATAVVSSAGGVTRGGGGKAGGAGGVPSTVVLLNDPSAINNSRQHQQQHRAPPPPVALLVATVAPTLVERLTNHRTVRWLLTFCDMNENHNHPQRHKNNVVNSISGSGGAGGSSSLSSGGVGTGGGGQLSNKYGSLASGGMMGGGLVRHSSSAGVGSSGHSSPNGNLLQTSFHMESVGGTTARSTGGGFGNELDAILRAPAGGGGGGVDFLAASNRSRGPPPQQPQPPQSASDTPRGTNLTRTTSNSSPRRPVHEALPRYMIAPPDDEISASVKRRVQDRRHLVTKRAESARTESLLCGLEFAMKQRLSAASSANGRQPVVHRLPEELDINILLNSEPSSSAPPLKPSEQQQRQSQKLSEPRGFAMMRASRAPLDEVGSSSSSTQQEARLVDKYMIRYDKNLDLPSTIAGCNAAAPSSSSHNITPILEGVLSTPSLVDSVVHGPSAAQMARLLADPYSFRTPRLHGVPPGLKFKYDIQVDSWRSTSPRRSQQQQVVLSSPGRNVQ